MGRGEYVAVCAWPMGISTLFALGVSQALTFHVGRRNYRISEIVTAAVVMGAVQGALTIAVGMVVLPHVLHGYPPAVVNLGILFLSLTPMVVLSAYVSNVFQGAQDLLRFNVIRVLAPAVYFVGLIAIYCSHCRSLWAVIASQLAGYVSACAVGGALIWSRFRPQWQWNSAAFPKILDFGVRTHATSLANYFNQRIDQLILSLILPPKQLGYYAVAVTLSTAVTVFSIAAGIVTFSHGSSQDREMAISTISRSFRASLAWLLLACIALYVLSPLLIDRVFGSAFDSSILACRILLPGALMIGMNQVLYNGSSALGRPGLPSIAEGVSMVITTVGLYLLVPRYGFVGAAIVSSAAYTVSFVVMLILARQFLGLPFGSLLFGYRPFRRKLS